MTPAAGAPPAFVDRGGPVVLFSILPGPRPAGLRP